MDTTTYVVECFWPEVDTADFDALDRRAIAAVAALDGEGILVAYRGCWLIREDEVVLCFFTGTRTDVTAAARRAEIPFERIHEGVHPARAPGVATPIDQADHDRATVEGPAPGG